MSLYAFISRKEDLLGLMVDEVLGESLVDDLPNSRRDALGGVARVLWQVCRAHPWLAAAIGQRSQLGPNALRHIEQLFQATCSAKRRIVFTRFPLLQRLPRPRRS